MNLQQLETDVQALKQAVFGKPRLRREDLQHRYGWSKATLTRRIADGTLPAPIRFPGQPLWREEDLEAAELSGQLPPPVSA